MAKISVIVPVYNVEKYIHRCVDSILAQTFTDYELILVDDGSPDNCGKICDEYAGKDSRIHVIHKENGGLSDARNAGIDWAFANSDSEWITFIDSDDWVHHKYLEALYTGATKYACLISSMQLTKVKSDIDSNEYVNQRVEISVESMEDVYTLFGKQVACYAPGRLYRKALWIDVRFPKSKKWEDVSTIYKVILKVEQIAFVHNDFYYYFFNNTGITCSEWTPSHFEEFKAYERQIKDKRIKEKTSICNRLKKQYLWCLQINLDFAEKSQLSFLKKSHLIHYLRRKLRIALLLYAKDANCQFKREKSLYDAAYPYLMQIYWKLKSYKNTHK